MEIVTSFIPLNLPPDVCDEMRQELALGVLLGEFDITRLADALPICRQRINKNEAKPFNHIYIDHPVSGTTLNRFDIAG
ncbi:MAG: hypothetical protein WBV94_31820 [Blastocatellia bacterium]